MKNNMSHNVLVVISRIRKNIFPLTIFLGTLILLGTSMYFGIRQTNGNNALFFLLTLWHTIFIYQFFVIKQKQNSINKLKGTLHTAIDAITIIRDANCNGIFVDDLDANALFHNLYKQVGQLINDPSIEAISKEFADEPIAAFDSTGKIVN